MSDNHAWNMNKALAMAAFSDDPSVQNGAVIGGLNIAGYNRLPFSVAQDQTRMHRRPQKYFWVEHAERDAIYTAAKKGVSLSRTSMYSPWAACADCARAIVASGISRLYRLPMGELNERWAESILVGDLMMREAGVKVIEIPFDSVVIPDGLRLGQWSS